MKSTIKSGRKSLDGSGKSPVFQIVMSSSQKNKLIRLGGCVWIRNAIDNATEKNGVCDGNGK